MIHHKKDLIYRHLRADILDGLRIPGEKLPRETELAKLLKVSHVTLRSSLARLEKEGLIERVHGVGTFVADPRARRKFLLLLPDLVDHVELPAYHVVAGLESAALEHGVILQHCPASWLSQFSFSEYAEMLRRARISGLILETGHHRPNPALVKLLHSYPLPIVIPHGLPKDSQETGFLVIRTNERAAISDGLLYLAARGHRRIASLLLRIEEEGGSMVRGFLRTDLEEFYRLNNLEAPDDLIAYIPGGAGAPIRETVRRWLLGGNPPSAILCHSDRVAMRVYSTLKELGAAIPGEISVLGYDNYPGGQLLLPPLSSIDTKLETCGKMALEKLCESDSWFHPGTTPLEIISPHEIIERKSVRKITGNKAKI
jgi:GntR family transcriptional regulator of arabinose operon